MFSIKINFLSKNFPEISCLPQPNWWLNNNSTEGVSFDEYIIFFSGAIVFLNNDILWVSNFLFYRKLKRISIFVAIKMEMRTVTFIGCDLLNYSGVYSIQINETTQFGCLRQQCFRPILSFDVQSPVYENPSVRLSRIKSNDFTDWLNFTFYGSQSLSNRNLGLYSASYQPQRLEGNLNKCNSQFNPRNFTDTIRGVAHSP